MLRSRTKTISRRRVRFLATCTCCAILAAFSSVTCASDVFVFHSVKNKTLWTALKPALASRETAGYRVDLLAVADYSAKQRVVAKAERSRVSIIVGPRAGKIMADISIGLPVVAVELNHSLKSGAHAVIYLMQNEVVETDVTLVSVSSPSAVGGLDLGQDTVLEIDAGARSR